MNEPFLARYGRWLESVLHGDMGQSIEKDIAVSVLLKESLTNTGILAFFVFLIMIPVSLTLIVLAAVNTGSPLDRVISIVAVLPTSIHQIASALLLTVVLGLRCGCVPASSATSARC